MLSFDKGEELEVMNPSISAEWWEVSWGRYGVVQADLPLLILAGHFLEDWQQRGGSGQLLDKEGEMNASLVPRPRQHSYCYCNV